MAPDPHIEKSPSVTGVDKGDFKRGEVLEGLNALRLVGKNLNHCDDSVHELGGALLSDFSSLLVDLGDE